jgi:methionyl aminopeptidase
MCLGIGMVRPGGHLGDIGYIIQQHAHAQGYSIVRKYAGHGIGKIFHDEPSVYHYGQPGTRELMVPGMIFTIEPMLNIGHHEVEALPDKWTIVTKDRSLSAQWEHTVLVTETGFELLTVSAGSPAFPEFPPLPAFFSAKRAASALV